MKWFLACLYDSLAILIDDVLFCVCVLVKGLTFTCFGIALLAGSLVGLKKIFVFLSCCFKSASWRLIIALMCFQLILMLPVSSSQMFPLKMSIYGRWIRLFWFMAGCILLRSMKVSCLTWVYDGFDNSCTGGACCSDASLLQDLATKLYVCILYWTPRRAYMCMSKYAHMSYNVGDTWTLTLLHSYLVK